MTVSPETLKKLTQFDTPTICNAIEIFDVRPRNAGYMGPQIQAAFPEMPPMVGFAATATFRSDAPPVDGNVYEALAQQVELFAQLEGPAVVVFQDIDDPPVAATFGEVMCSTYQGFGAAGLVSSGAGRDLEQIRALGFPVFTGSTICAHAYCHTLQIGAPVRVGGLNIQTGQLLHGDLNGVTQIPLDIADELADITPEFVKAEDHVLNYVKGPGEKDAKELRERQAMLRADVANLSKRCSRKRN